MNIALISSSTSRVNEIVGTFMLRGLHVFHYPNHVKCLQKINQEAFSIFSCVLIDYDTHPQGAKELVETFNRYRQDNYPGIFMMCTHSTGLPELDNVTAIPHNNNFNPTEVLGILLNYIKSQLHLITGERRTQIRISPGQGERISVYMRTPNNQLLSGDLVNISIAGLLIRSKQTAQFESGKSAGFQLKLRGQQALFQGLVAFAKGNMVGVKFQKMDAQSKMTIARYVFEKINDLNLVQYVRHQKLARKPS